MRVSTDARVYETGRTEPVIVFHEYGNTGDGVLVHIEKLAQKIAGQILEEGQTDASATSQEKTGTQPPSPEPAFSWHSQKLPFSVVGLSAGDLDGDGRIKWVLAGENAVYIYSIQADALVLEATFAPEKQQCHRCGCGGIWMPISVPKYSLPAKKERTTSIRRWSNGTEAFMPSSRKG